MPDPFLTASPSGLPAPAPPAVKAAPVADTLTVVVRGFALSSWQDVRIARGIELFPSYFSLRISERLASAPARLPILPGDTCVVMVGKDVLVTGYVDSYDVQVAAQEHVVAISGRSITSDLVDCAAGVKDGQEQAATMTFRAATLLQLAQDLCGPFGIKVTEPDGEGAPLVSVGDGIPQFTIPLGQSVYDAIEPYARWLAMLPLDGADGGLVLAKISTKKIKGGFALPGNVETARLSLQKQHRYTVYLPAQHPFEQAFDVAAAANGPAPNFLRPVKDNAFDGQLRLDGKPRYRPHFVVSEQYLDSVSLAEKRADWERSRDYGRSQVLAVTVGTWRDDDGKLWAPNTLAEVEVPGLQMRKLVWIIAEVQFLRSLAGGTRAIVTLMPPEAFQVEPSLLTPYDPLLSRALDRAADAPVAAPAPPAARAN